MASLSLKKLSILGLGYMMLMGCHPIYSPQQSLAPSSYSDEALAENIKSTLISHPLLTRVPMEIEVQGGVVVLKGYVKTIRQSDTAEMLARKVSGVSEVQNNLIVRK